MLYVKYFLRLHPYVYGQDMKQMSGVKGQGQQIKALGKGDLLQANKEL
jgi:hypothetical protein